eukprot:1854455-Rhodomonas_salina.1
MCIRDRSLSESDERCNLVVTLDARQHALLLDRVPRCLVHAPEAQVVIPFLLQDHPVAPHD